MDWKHILGAAWMIPSRKLQIANMEFQGKQEIANCKELSWNFLLCNLPRLIFSTWQKQARKACLAKTNQRASITFWAGV